MTYPQHSAHNPEDFRLIENERIFIKQKMHIYSIIKSILF